MAYEEHSSDTQSAVRTREDAHALLCSYTEGENLRRHAYAVEAAMRWYARKFGENEEQWAVCGLLHDFDYERHPELSENGHPYVGARILAAEKYPAEIIEAIMGHAVYSGVERKTLMAKALFACDELTGMITAAVLVRPDRSLYTLTAKSVLKKMKDKAFARAVNREEIAMGAEELGIPLAEHISNVIEAMKECAAELGLDGGEER